MEATDFFCELILTSPLDEGKALIHLLFETHIEHAISFVDNQVLQEVHLDVFSVLQMIEETTWSAHENCTSFAKP